MRRRPLPCSLLVALAPLALLVGCGGSSSPTDPGGGGDGGRVSGTVFSDANGDGTRDESEPGLGGVTVQIFHDSACSGAVSGSALATLTTPASGQYAFTDLATSAAGTCYTVQVTPPPQHASTSTNPQGVQLRDSAPNRQGLDFGIHERGLFFTPSGAPTANSLYLDLAQGPPSATAWRAELRVSQVQNLYGVAFDLLFPAELLSYTGATEGTFLSGEANTTLQIREVAPGHLVVGLTRLGNFLGANGSGLLMSFDFSVAADNGHGELSFTANSAVDGAGQPKGLNWRGGSVLVLR